MLSLFAYILYCYCYGVKYYVRYLLFSICHSELIAFMATQFFIIYCIKSLRTRMIVSLTCLVMVVLKFPFILLVQVPSEWMIS